MLQDHAELDNAVVHNGLSNLQTGVQTLLRQETEAVSAYLPVANTGLKVLLQQARIVFKAVNAAIRNAKTSRNDRFFLQGLHDGSLVSDKADGHICDEDTVAVLLELEPKKGAKPTPKAQREASVYYGHVQSMTLPVNNKPRHVHKAHLEEPDATVTCKWFLPIMDANNAQDRYEGLAMFVLPLIEVEGFNNRVTMSNVLSAVRMKFCPKRKCCLLHPDDHAYAEQQRQRYTKYIRMTVHRQKQVGVFKKDSRDDHDRMKLNLDF